VFAAGTAHRINRRPRDEHRHDGGFARARGELESEAGKIRVGVFVGAVQQFEDFFPAFDKGATSVSQMAVSTAST